ncbi:hypothetical protein P43SY_008112 [Pythium insidiosum]|uniref:RRM domain-containing protein n=1 Tax=Pythium insidiosum TaxID=114742 RepID=A0AAD5QA20_PYTIN|nr:hypothetical protein P43SY_008112 [Pythium insidiosum]
MQPRADTTLSWVSPCVAAMGVSAERLALSGTSVLARTAGSTSWADDDDLDAEPLPAPATLPKVEERQPEREAPRRDARSPRRDHRGSDDYTEHGARQDRGHGDRGGYRGERGDRRAPRGGHDADRQRTPVPDEGPYKIYVGNLPFTMHEDDLAELFGQADISDVRIPRDRDSDRPKGFAYVEFKTREALVEALQYDGRVVDGRAVRIDVAAEKDRKPRQKDNSFFERRSDRPRRGHDEPRDAPAERKRLTLLPRSTSNEGNNPSSPRAPKANPFGDAKPRDENAFWERKKADELAAKQAAAKAKAEASAKKVERSTSGGARERKSSHDDAGEGGRGAGRGGRGGRGERHERAPPASGRGGRQAAGAATATAAATASKKEEPKTKRAEAPKSTKIAPPASTKVNNLFNLLDDSDSD